jgi:2-methylcitrate dehydratase
LDNTREKLVTYVSDLKFSDLTPAAIHAVKRSVVDAMGCAVGAYHAEPVRAACMVASETMSKRPATIIGTDIKTSPEMAAFVNGTMVRYSDFSDDYFGGNGETGPHPSDNIGAIMAATESAGADGKALVTGVATVYEVCGQIVDHSRLQARDRGRGWDYPIFHAIATSLAGGRILGLTKEQLRNALSIAVVPNICLNQTRYKDLSNWKAFAGPNGSRNGLFAAIMARAGITGPAEPFEGIYGYMKQLADPFTLGTFGSKTTPFKVEGTYFKYMPVRYTIQLSIWVALELRTKVKLEDIVSMCVVLEDGSSRVVKITEMPEYWDPKSRETADHSFPYLIGAALVDGEITEKTFTPERFRDPQILALIQKISFSSDKAYKNDPRIFNCRIDTTLKSGQVISLHQTNPRGHPANPMTDREIEDKFLKQVRPVLPEQQCQALLARLWKLEELENMKQLLDLMRVPGNP